MSEGVSFHFENGVVWLGLSEGGPRVLSATFANALGEALAKAIATPQTRCIVLSGAPKGFPRGNTNIDRPDLEDTSAISGVLDQIEASPIPVVAIIPDAAINEGLELAMAAHFRISSKSARFGYNHISTGLIPALGGSQRLPRLAGAKFALEVLLNGKIFTAHQALDAGLLDLVTDTDFASEATGFIQDIVQNDVKPRPTGGMIGGQSNPTRYQAQMNEARKLVESFKIPAAGAIVECVEAAQITPLAVGLNIERSKYIECLNSDEAHALRHVAIAEKRLSRPTRIVGNFVSVCVLGAKPEDSGLCVALLDAGLEVTVVDHLGPPHPSMSGAIIGIYDNAVQNGRMTPEVRSSRVARLDVVQLEGIEEVADVIVDAGKVAMVEVLDWLKPRLAATQRPRMLLTARTLTEATDLAKELPDGVECAAFHFEKPPHIAKVVEVFELPDQSASALDGIQEFFRIVKRLPILIEGQDEPISAGIRKTLFQTAEALLLHGAEPKQIDGALGEFGFRQGPLAWRDEIGLELDLVPGQQPATEALVESGRTGRDVGLGYFRYAKGDPRPRPDGVVVWSLTNSRDGLGIEALDFSDQEILYLFIGALVNFGAKMLDEDVVQRASDIDVLAVHTIGFPRRRGGPMQAAEQVGLFRIAQTLGRYATLAPELWQPHSLISELIKYGQGFEQMDLPDLDEAS